MFVHLCQFLVPLLFSDPAFGLELTDIAFAFDSLDAGVVDDDRTVAAIFVHVELAEFTEGKMATLGWYVSDHTMEFDIS